MVEKNRVKQTEGDNDLVVKHGHGILKAIYTSQVGDRNWIIRDGVTVCPAVGTVTICSPVANTFACGTVTISGAQEELTACGTITVSCALEEVAATGTIIVSCCACMLVGEVHAFGDIVVCCPTIEATACGTATMACVLAADFLTLNGRVYTAVCGIKDCTHTQFSICGGNNAVATDLLDSLNNDTRCETCMCGTTNAIACAVITVTTVAAALASNSVVFTSSNARILISCCGFTCGKDADQVTVDGLTYTGVCGAKMCCSEFNICGSCATIATDLADSICMDPLDCMCIVSASSCCATVTALAVLGGTGCAQNCIAMTTNACARLCLSGASFCCGVAGDFVTLNGLVYTATVGARATDAQFSIDTSVCAATIDLAAAICADTRTGVLSDLSATSMCVTVTVTDKNACCMGSCGNCITLATSDSCSLTISGCCLTGGNTACTVTVDGNIYTAVCMAKADNTEFSTDTSDCATAIDLADSICMDARAGTEACLDVTAAQCPCNCDAVLVTAVCSGNASNAITLASSCATTLLVSCTTLLGGNDACTVTVNGLIYTAATATTPCCGLFKVDCETDCAAAVNLDTAISCDCRAGTLGCMLSATNAANIVTVTTDVLGTPGDAVTLVSNCGTTLSLTGAGFFTGGVDADTVTINGLVYLGVAAAECACGEWDTRCGDCVVATALAVAISCDSRFPCCVTVATHDVNAAEVAEVVTITADAGERGSDIDLASSSATRLLTSGTFLTGGVGRELLEIDLVAAGNGELTMNFLNTPMRDGIFVDFIAGTSGRIVIVFE